MIAKIVSFVSVGSKTWVRAAVAESERFLPLIDDGYGTWFSPLRHQSPITNGWVSRCRL